MAGVANIDVRRVRPRSVVRAALDIGGTAALIATYEIIARIA